MTDVDALPTVEVSDSLYDELTQDDHYLEMATVPSDNDDDDDDAPPPPRSAPPVNDDDNNNIKANNTLATSPPNDNNNDDEDDDDDDYTIPPAKPKEDPAKLKEERKKKAKAEKAKLKKKKDKKARDKDDSESESDDDVPKLPPVGYLALYRYCTGIEKFGSECFECVLRKLITIKSFSFPEYVVQLSYRFVVTGVYGAVWPVDRHVFVCQRRQQFECVAFELRLSRHWNVSDSISSFSSLDSPFVFVSAIVGFFQTMLNNYIGSKMADRIRILYIKALLRQEMGW